MNQNEKIKGAGIKYTEANKEFLAAFYGLARHNVYLTLCHIARRIGINEPVDEDKSIEWFKHSLQKFGTKGNKVSAITVSRFFELTDHHFPFIKFLNYSNKTATAIRETEKDVILLLELLEKLNQFRNMYAHKVYQGDQPKDLKGLTIKLERIFDANIKQVKEDFYGLNVRQTKDQKDEVETKFDHLRRLRENTDRSIVDDRGKEIRAVPNENFHYHFLTKDLTALTVFGHVFFASLFLDKKNAVLMQKWVKGMKGSHEERYRMTSEVFCRSRIILPRVRMRSERSDDALILDMLNELGKAPEQFYEQLPIEEAKKFEIVSSDRIDLADDYDSETNTYVQTKRYENRFPYFALRYMEEANAFKSMRFQIDLGNYHFHIYNAEINGQQEPRHLVRRLFGFGKLDDFKPEQAPLAWKEKQKDLDYYENAKEPFIGLTYPHYHLEDNKIGIKFLEEGTTPAWPHLDVESHPNYPKYRRDKVNKSDVADAFLSVHELLPMVFCHLLYSKVNQTGRVEQILSEKQKNITKLIEHLANGNLERMIESYSGNEAVADMIWKSYKLKLSEVPERLKLLLEKVEVKRRFKKDEQKMKEMIDDNTKRIEWFKNDRTKRPVSPRDALKAGRYASWLVDDLMRFQPLARKKDAGGKMVDDLKSKANPKKYQLLQKSLAMYGLERENLIGLFKACNLLDSDNAHPFLKEITLRLPDNWMDFYAAYLQSRANYLNKQQRDANSAKNYAQCYHFLKIKNNGNDREKLSDGWNRQIMLPTGMFDSAIRQWFKENASPTLQNWYNTEAKIHSIEKLIEQFLKIENDDCFQEYYSDLRMCYDFYREKHPNGLTLGERENLYRTQWADALQKDKAVIKTMKNDYERIVKKLSKVEADLQSIQDPNALENRMKAEFGADTIAPLISKIHPKKFPDKAEKLFKLLSEGLTEKYITTRNRISDFRRMLDNEKQLRRIKAEDGLTMLMIQSLMKLNQVNVSKSETPMKLKEIRPMGENSETGTLNQVRDQLHNLEYFPSDYTGKVFNKEKPLGKWTLISTDTKIKKLGNFRKLIKDQRLNNLAQYLLPVADDAIHHRVNLKQVEYELDQYDRERVNIIKHIHELEQVLFDKGIYTVDAEGYVSFRTGILVPASVRLQLDTQLTDALIAIRNSIMHNQYPSSKYLPQIKHFAPDQNIVSPVTDMGIIRQISELTPVLVNQIIDKINKS